MNEISRTRFDALAGYCRGPKATLEAEEVRWLEADSERILVTVIQDRIDEDYAAIYVARDLKERYRSVGISDFYPSIEDAVAEAAGRVPEMLAQFGAVRSQGDEVGKPVDFFSPVVAPEKLHPSFVSLSTLEGYSPALELIKPMMRWYEDVDGNFIEQFQTTGFDTRMWELYLFATMAEQGFAFDTSQAVPDFVGRGLLGTICIEATTVNPSRDSQGNLVPPPPLNTREDFVAFEQEYMPIRFAGPLTAKLAKKYWERPNVAGRPLVIAVQDFHAPMSMTLSRGALPTYLYGFVHYWRYEEDGKLVILPKRVGTHRWGAKEVPSGFFSLPGAENISAVVSNPSATISKFNRMGAVAGFGSPRVRQIRRGLAADFDPNAAAPLPFARDVNDPDYSERWIEGMDVYHNPNALHPLDPMQLPGAAHHRLLPDGQVETLAPAWQPMSSHTLISIDESADARPGAEKEMP